jgi:hypothetical protein
MTRDKSLKYDPIYIHEQLGIKKSLRKIAAYYGTDIGALSRWLKRHGYEEYRGLRRVEKITEK